MELQPHLNFSLDDMPNEIWKPVKGYEELYQVSSLGRLKAIAGYCYGKNKGNVFKRDRINRIRVLTIESNGYMRTRMTSLGKKAKMYSIHRMVADSFIPNPENKPYVNHINGIKTDNRFVNLEWCTPKENIVHSFSFGNRKAPTGENSPVSILKDEQVIEIVSMLKNGVLKVVIAKKFNVSAAAIYRISMGQTWQHITR